MGPLGVLGYCGASSFLISQVSRIRYDVRRVVKREKLENSTEKFF